MIHSESVFEARLRISNEGVKPGRPVRVTEDNHVNGHQDSGAVLNGLDPNETQVLTSQPVIYSGPPSVTPTVDAMRDCAWECGKYNIDVSFLPAQNHVAIAPVGPKSGFVHWRLLHSWIEETARKRGNGWHQCRMIVRIYDVSFIIFNGLNAHRIINIPITQIAGSAFFTLPLPNTTQLVEVGFELKNGEFIPGTRSQFVRFPAEAVSNNQDASALLVDDKLKVESAGNVWQQREHLEKRRQARIQQPRRIATFAFESLASGHDSVLAKFVTELATAQRALGHQIHIFIPKTDVLNADCEINGIHYHPLDVRIDESPITTAVDFARASEEGIRRHAPFDLLHLHEWMTGLTPSIGTIPTLLSLSSTEQTRLNGSEPTPLSTQIEKIEGETLDLVDCVLAPEAICPQIVAGFGIAEDKVHAFNMDGHFDPWDTPIDIGKVKIEIGFGPLDQMIAFVGPLEHVAGPDILIEALPVALQRNSRMRVAMLGTGGLQGHLQNRANQCGVGYALRMINQLEGTPLMNLMRSADALVLPARARFPGDQEIIDMARHAGRPVVTTHTGPSQLVRHEENGLVIYDNPNSLVWGLDRVLGDRENSQRLGRNSKQLAGEGHSWSAIARRYFEICEPLINETGDFS